MKTYNGLIGCATSVILTIIVAPVQSTSLTFTDSIFNNTNWSASIVLNIGTEPKTFTAEQVTNGGNPNEYRKVTHVFGHQAMWVAHLRKDAIYQPAVNGAISKIDFSFDLIYIQPFISGGAVRYRPLLFQDGNYYVSLGSLIFDEVWTTFEHPGLTDSDFFNVDLLGGKPDFSASGGVIQLGYLSGNSTGASFTPLITTKVSGIDNWSTSITPIPEPSTLALFSIGVLGMFGFLRKRRKA